MLKSLTLFIVIPLLPIPIEKGNNNERVVLFKTPIIKSLPLHTSERTIPFLIEKGGAFTPS